ncbi:hypothetical protein ACFUMH_12725 [Cellulomonas sp. NPDC057328]|uniref:hypothetical protein n=1 Tax=Cellulomonas sp. NPDC057328 TaxID=3346101 RepID=UPI00362C2B27
MLRPELPVWLVREASYAVSPGLVLVEDGLRDADGAHFALNGSGRLLCAIGQAPAHVGTVVEMLAARTGAAREEMDGQLRDFLVDMSARGLVTVHQSHVRELLAVARALPWILSAALIDRRLAYRGRLPLRRYPASLRAVVTGTLEAHQALCWVALALAGLLAVVLGTRPVDSLNVLQTATAPQAMAGMLAFFLVLVLSLVAHEWSHYVVARATRCDAYGFYVRSGAAGLSFRAPGRRAHVAVALAGPVGGVLAIAALTAPAALVPPDVWIWLGADQLQASWYAAAAVLTLYHLAALTPLGKDGRQLLQLLRGTPEDGRPA